MSEENGDSAAEAGASAPSAGGNEFGAGADAGVSDPALADRLENIHQSMSTLGSRIDALVTSTTSYRAALTDRLDEYIERLAAVEELLGHVRASVSGDGATPGTDELDGRLAGIEDRLAVLAGADPASALAGRFDTLHAAIQDLSSNLTDEVTDTARVGETVDRVEREVASTSRVASETWSELAGLGAKVDTVLEATANESGSVSAVLEELKVTLQDLASGEVVGSLWDEFRHLRATVETLVEHTGATADPDAVEALRADVVELTGSVRDLLQQAEVVADEEDEEGDLAPAPVADGALDQLAADVASLRRELAEGLVLEVSDDLGTSVDQLRDEVAGVAQRVAAVAEVPDTVAERLAPLGEMRDTVAELRDTVAELRDREAPTPGPATVDTSGLDEELRAVRVGVDDIIARLEEGLDLEIDTSSMAAPPPVDAAVPDAQLTSELADQIAGLRDFVTTEFDAVRQQLTGADLDASSGGAVDLGALTARLDRLHDDIADQQSLAEELATARDTAVEAHGGAAVDLTPVTDALAELQEAMAFLLDASAAPAGQTPPAGSAPEFATLDPDTVDLLREEIRASATPNAELIDTLNTELKALRRRIRLRAEGEIFSDEQLELIADAVARRLAGEQ